ncbi:MAG: SH3 domain-containing protein [Flavobacteriales bacterium]|nr:SH3 domain-containing protein [Flavobacteriales bacterium]
MKTAALLTFFLPGFLLAQNPDVVYHTPRQQYGMPEEAPIEYILRGGSALRSAPSVDAALMATLPAGQPVFIEEKGEDTLRLDGVLSHWYRVTAGKHTGWTWGGNLAEFAFGSAADASVKFVAGLEHYRSADEEPTNTIFRLVALRNGQEIDRLSVRSFAHDIELVRGLGNLGLREVDDVIVLTVPCYGGCGCTTGEVVVFWAGGRFHHVADLMGSPDGDYSTNVSFIFPSDMEGEAGIILRRTSDYEDAECDDADVEGAMPGNCIERIAREERLAWNGTKLVLQGEPQERRYLMRTGN